MDSSNKIDISRFDPTNASDDHIRLWLFAIIQAELEKDDAEIDEELIDECSDCEAFLSHSNPEITQEEYTIGLARIKERAQAIQADGSNVTVQAKPKKRHFMRVAVYFLAATLAVAILSVSVVAAFNGSAAWEFIVENIGWIWNADSGDTLDNGKVTLIKGETVSEYDSVEEALKAGGFDSILFPTVLPEGINIDRIVQIQTESDRYELSFVFNTQDITYGVSNYPTDNHDKWNTYNQHTVGDLTFYIIEVNNGRFQAVWNNNGFEYNITYVDYNELIKILNYIN